MASVKMQKNQLMVRITTAHKNPLVKGEMALSIFSTSSIVGLCLATHARQKRIVDSSHSNARAGFKSLVAKGLRAPRPQIGYQVLSVSTRLESLMSAAMAYNQVAKDYDSSFHSNVALAEDDVIYGMVRNWLVPGWTIDLGCGTGALLEHIKILKEDYWGVDAAEEMVKIAAKKFSGYPFSTAPMESALRLIKPSSASNIISLFGSCSYADLAIYPLIWRALRPGGRYFLMLFNKRYENRKTYILKRHMVKAPFHTYLETKPTWPAPFSWEHVRGFNFTGDSLDWLPRSWIRWILRRELSGLGRLWPQHALFVLAYGEKKCSFCPQYRIGIIQASCVQCHQASIGAKSAKTPL